MKRLWWGVLALALVAAGCSGSGGGTPGGNTGGGSGGQLSSQNPVFSSNGFAVTVVPVNFAGGQVAQVSGTIADTQGGAPATFFVTPNANGTFNASAGFTVINGHTYQVNLQAFDATGAPVGAPLTQAFVANLTGSTTGSTTATTGNTTATTGATTASTTGTTTATTTATTGATTSGTITGPPPPPSLPTS